MAGGGLEGERECLVEAPVTPTEKTLRLTTPKREGEKPLSNNLLQHDVGQEREQERQDKYHETQWCDV